MVLFRQWPLILLALIFSVGPLFGANSEEERALAVASDKLHNSFFESAERDFGDFAQKYPYSIHLPEAILYRAQARISSGQPLGAIDLLSTNQERADKLAPLYTYWIARAYFENQDYAKAAAVFDDFVKKFPKSPQSLDALVREASALARLERWPQVIGLLEQTNGVFQETVHAGATSETIASGYLLLGDARLAQGKLSGVDEILRLLDKQTLNSDLKWQRDYLASRRQWAEGRLEDALLSSASLLLTSSSINRAEGVALQAGVLEQLDHLEDAVNAYTNNLTADAPVEQQRRAILKITELDLKQNKLPEAAQNLQGFLKQFPNAGASDLAMLTLGEVRLKQALAGSNTNLTGGETNLFEKALVQFDNLLNTFTNNPFAGKALLGRGWSLWSQGKIVGSEEAFHSAMERLPFSEEQAEARFKWADAQFELKNLAGAITNYTYLAENYSSLPEAKDLLVERALYQLMRVALDAKDLATAANAVEKILAWYPDGFAGPASLLLTGQGLAEQKDPAAARKSFATFEELYPTSALLPEVRLAIARSYEAEGNWDAAITNYSAWTDAFTNHHLIPQARFSLAWDNYMAGHEANALMLFTNFIAQFPTNPLSARAQWWMGDFYFRQKDYQAAEINYQLVYQNTNLPPSDLTYQARMMAGRSAMGRYVYKQAINYFTNLLSPDCPRDLQVQATLAYADALSRQESTNKPADLNDAIQSLKTIPQSQGDSWAAAQAWGKIGDCYFDWGSLNPDQYTNATIAYTKVVNARGATGAARSEARFNLGAVTEKQAALKSGDDQTDLLKQALRQYVDAFYQNLHDPDKPSPLWTKKAGISAGQLAESLQDWQAAYCVYSQLETLLPVMAPVCDKKKSKALDHGASPDRCQF